MSESHLSDESAAALRRIDARLADLRSEIVVILADRDHAKRRLKERAKIERAKWLLVERHKVSESVAHAMLQKQATRSNKSIEEVCDGLLMAAELQAAS